MEMSEDEHQKWVESLDIEDYDSLDLQRCWGPVTKGPICVENATPNEVKLAAKHVNPDGHS